MKSLPESGRHVVISNVFSDDNRGGAAITAGTIEMARHAFPGCAVSLVTVTAPSDRLHVMYRHTLRRFPDVELLSPLVEVSKGALGGARAVIRSFWLLAWPRRYAGRPTVDRIRGASIVIGKGGQVFRGRRGWSDLAGFWLALLPLVFARRLGVPTALHGITVGPYPARTMAAALAGWILRRVDLVLVRDARSYEQARALGVDAVRLEQVPDAVFSMSPRAVERSPVMTEQIGPEEARFGVVTVMTSKGVHDFELFDFLGTAVRQLLERGVVQRVAVVLQTDGPGTSDRIASQAFVDRLADPRVRLFDADLSPEELMALYGAADFTIGCRVHSAVFSVIAGTPAFPVLKRTTVKAGDIFRTLGLERYVVRMEGSREAQEGLARRLADDIEQAVSGGEAVRAELIAAVARMRDDQELAVRRLRTLREERWSGDRVH